MLNFFQTYIWRREWDSNPRGPYDPTRSQGVLLRPDSDISPLSHTASGLGRHDFHSIRPASRERKTFYPIAGPAMNYRLSYPEQSGGEGGIRTHEGLTTLPLFESGAFGQLGHLSFCPGTAIKAEADGEYYHKMRLFSELSRESLSGGERTAASARGIPPPAPLRSPPPGG